MALTDEATPTAQATTASYADVGTCVAGTLANKGLVTTVMGQTGALSVTCRETGGTNGIKWQVVASDDPDFSTPVTVKAEATIAASGVDSYTEDHAHFAFYKVQVKDATGGSHGTALAHLTAKS